MFHTLGRLSSSKLLTSSPFLRRYNAVLSFNQLIDHADLVFTADNEQLYNILKRNFKQESPSYSDLNHLIARTMSGISTPFRFSGQLNSDLRKLGTNLVPFPRLHFFTTAYAPLVAPGHKAFKKSSVAEIISDLMDSKNQMAAADIRSGKFLTVACYLRGRDLSTREVDEAMSAIQRKARVFRLSSLLARPRLSLSSRVHIDCPVSLHSSSVSTRFCKHRKKLTPSFQTCNRTENSLSNGFQTPLKLRSVQFQLSTLLSVER